ncbi:MAG: hypothetical protein ACK5X3_02710 [Pseudomonadota bacterium]|jgi:hypothetical protein
MNKGKQLKAVYDRLKIGDKITVHQAVEASYSNYAGNPTILFTPEDVAIVTNVRIPCVVKSDAYRGEFVRASFTRPVTVNRSGYIRTDSDWSVAVDYQNVKIISQE